MDVIAGGLVLLGAAGLLWWVLVLWRQGRGQWHLICYQWVDDEGLQGTGRFYLHVTGPEQRPTPRQLRRWEERRRAELGVPELVITSVSSIGRHDGEPLDDL